MAEINADLQERLRRYKEQKRQNERNERATKNVTTALWKLSNLLKRKGATSVANNLADLAKNKPYKKFITGVNNGFSSMTKWSRKFFNTFNANASNAQKNLDDVFKLAILNKLSNAGEQLGESVQSLYDVQVDMSRKYHMTLSEIQEANKSLFEARDKLGNKFSDKEIWEQAVNRKDAGLRLDKEGNIRVAQTLASAEKVLADKFDGKEFASQLRTLNNFGTNTDGRKMLDAMVAVSKVTPEIYEQLKSGFGEMLPTLALMYENEDDVADWINKKARAEKRKEFQKINSSSIDDAIKSGDMSQIIQKAGLMGLDVDKLLNAYMKDPEVYQDMVEQGTKNVVEGAGFTSMQNYMKNNDAFGYFMAKHTMNNIGMGAEIDNYSKIKKAEENKNFGKESKELTEELQKGNNTETAVEKMHVSQKEQWKNLFYSTWGIRKMSEILGDLDLGIVDVYAGIKLLMTIKDAFGGGLTAMGGKVVQSIGSLGLTVQQGMNAILAKMGVQAPNIGGNNGTNIPGGANNGSKLNGFKNGLKASAKGGALAGVMSAGLNYMSGDSGKTAVMKGGLSATGSIVGGALGGLLGPVGMAVGSVVGGFIGDGVGGIISNTNWWKSFDNDGNKEKELKKITKDKIDKGIEDGIKDIRNNKNKAFGRTNRAGERGNVHSAAIGFDYIPKDNMQVNVHKGERILTKEENKKFYENLKGYKGIDDNLINSDDSLMVAKAKKQAQRRWLLANKLKDLKASLVDKGNKGLKGDLNTNTDISKKAFENLEGYKGIKDNLINKDDSVIVAKAKLEAQRKWLMSNKLEDVIKVDKVENNTTNITKGNMPNGSTVDDIKKYYENMAGYNGIKENLINKEDSLTVAKAKLEAQRKWLEQQANSSVKDKTKPSNDESAKLLKWGFNLIAEKIGNIQTNTSVYSSSTQEKRHNAPSIPFMLENLTEGGI